MSFYIYCSFLLPFFSVFRGKELQASVILVTRLLESRMSRHFLENAFFMGLVTEVQRCNTEMCCISLLSESEVHRFADRFVHR